MMTKQILTCLFCVFGMTSSGLSVASSKLTDGDEVVTNTIQVNNGKPGASVALTYTVPKNVVANNAIGVTLNFTASSSQGTLDVNINADAGLSLLSKAALPFELNGLSVSSTVSLLPKENGLHYLNINVTQTSLDGQSRQSRAFAVPIQVGLSKQKPNKVNGRLTNDGEEKIIEMIAK